LATHEAVAWITLENRDDSLHEFICTLFAALITVVPRQGDHTIGSLYRADDSSQDYLALALSDELANPGRDLIIVLDDFHVIQSPEVRAFLADLIGHLPPQVHLVILSRTDPPLPLGRLRAHDDLVEIRNPQLSFRRDEQHTFLSLAFGVAPSIEALTAIDQRTEGWATGLRLHVLAQSQGPQAEGPPQAQVSSAFNEPLYAREFLINEVLAAQAADVQAVLLRASVPSQICGPLLDALCGDVAVLDEGVDRLETIARANAFLMPADGGGTWYRFHPLFREALLHKLKSDSSAATLANLHLRTSEWLVAHGRVEEGIDHALEAGDPERAAVLLEETDHSVVLGGENAALLARSLHKLPWSLVVARPALLMIQIWVHLLRWRLDDVPPLLHIVERLLESTSLEKESQELRMLRTELSCQWSWLFNACHDYEHALAAAERALEYAPAGWSFARRRAEVARAFALQMLGRTDEAITWLNALYAEDTLVGAPRLTSSLYALARIYVNLLQLEDAEIIARRLLGHGSDSHQAAPTAWGHFYLGLLCYEQNDLLGAREHLRAALAWRDSLKLSGIVDATMALALTDHTLGDPEQAIVALDELSDLLEETSSWNFLAHVQGLRARIDLEQGDLEAASNTLKRIGGIRGTEASFVEEPRVTRIRCLLLHDTPASIVEAEALLQDLAPIGGVGPHPRNRLRADLLRALVLEARSDSSGALMVLEDAVERARPAGLVRSFVDFGPPMFGLLTNLARRKQSADPFIEHLTDAFPQTAPRTLGPLPHGTGQDLVLELVEPLTWRELDILELIAHRLSNKEIGAKLTISPLTVKRHSINIYQKLQVGGRREAVEKATDLGLLGPT